MNYNYLYISYLLRSIFYCNESATIFSYFYIYEVEVSDEESVLTLSQGKSEKFDLLLGA